PVVLDVAEVVLLEVDPERLERALVELLGVRGRGLHDDLVLVVVLEPKGVLAVAAVRGPPRGLDVGALPGLGPERAQERVRVQGPRALLHVVRLGEDAAHLLRPEVVEPEDDVLEREHRMGNASMSAWRSSASS